MDTITLGFIVVCVIVLIATVIVKSRKKGTPSRQAINIDFDTAKDREDKNRHFS